jgi:TonB family protein
MLAAACWFVTGAFPLAAEPQMVADAPGVSVDLNGAQLIHRSPVSYPREVMQKGIQGTVVVQAKLNANGEVTDANILSGPDELRKPAIRSVLDWHFMNAAGGTRQVSIAFELPKEPVNTLAGGVVGGVQQGAPGGSAPSASPATAAPGPMTLRRIDTMGLSDEARSELLSRLPVRQGDNISDDQVSRVRDAVREFDGHLNVSLKLRSNREASIMISSPAANLITTPTVVAPPGSIRVGGNVQQANLVSKITPVYPPLAKQARIQGTVSLYALIGKDGHIEDLSVIQGHPLLVQATLDAVQDWVYKPTLLNGNPVEVLTQIDVNFTLSQ